MQQDTKTIIKQLKKQLPGMRERVTAAALLLAMSVAMLTSASFAWVTLSKAPEVSDITTSISANGNLEIALSDKDGKAPDKSAVGDSSASGNPITSANLTWGNLVNLTDGYGLNELTLRPAILDVDGLLKGKPLWAAAYDTDGRVYRLHNDFSFANWQPPEGNVPGMFKVSEQTQYGVRAIASVTYSSMAGDAKFGELVQLAQDDNGKATSTYNTLVGNGSYMDSLASLMGVYLTAKLNDDQTVDVTDYVDELYAMLLEFQTAFYQAGDALAKTVNVYQYIKNGGKEGYTPYTREMLTTNSEANILADTGLTSISSQFRALQLYRTDISKVDADVAAMATLNTNVQKNSATVTWEEISTIVNNLVNISSTVLIKDGNRTQVGSIGMSNATQFLDGKACSAEITKGYIHDFEEISGARMDVKGLKVSAKYIITVSITADVHTDLGLKSTGLIGQHLDAASESYGNAPKQEDAVAQDTYGLALDFWVRTNASGSALTLNGALVTHKENKNATVAIGDQTYNVYTAQVMLEGATEVQTVDVIQVDEKWYLLDGETKGGEITPEGTPTQKVEEVTIITGVEGANRIWQDNPLLVPENTTQGSGSFYIYYADSPEDAQRSLDLLKHIKVAFMDENNNYLATATMQTGENEYYSVNGKYYIPLKITDGGVSLTDKNGEEYRGIMTLQQNVAVRITAILYLDGATLGNDQVLAASDIQGVLNLQFGSSAELYNLDDADLLSAVRTVTATADNVLFNYDSSTTPMTTNVFVDVTGTDAQRITARFQRAISATQGTRMEEFVFEQVSDGKWKGSFTFSTPGTYILRSVTLDGVEVDLPEPITVTVEGFTIASLTMNSEPVMTASSSVTRPLSLRFVTNDLDKMPKTVQARFMHDGGNTVNVNMTYNPTTAEWTGNAIFGVSGIYTLEYLVLDGKYTELDENLQKRLDIKLGMKTEVVVTRQDKVSQELKDAYGNPVYETNEDGSYKLDENGNKIPVVVMVPEPMDFEYQGGNVNFDVSVKIMDGEGNEIPYLEGVKLVYLQDGSLLDENGLVSDLVWKDGKYVGQFNLTKAGVFDFGRLQIGDSESITRATQSPTITARSPEPPSYVAGTAELKSGTSGLPVDNGDGTYYIYAPNGDVYLHLQMAYSSTGTYYAVFEHNGEEVEVQGGRGAQSGDVNAWSFLLKGSETTQDGTWKLLRLEATGVYDKEGVRYDESNPMLLPVEDLGGQPLTIIQTVNIEFVKLDGQTDAGGYVFGKDASGNTTGKFMDAYQNISFALKVTDVNGNELPEGLAITDVNISLVHNPSTAQTHGGYTNADVTAGGNSNGMQRYTLSFTSSDHMNFTYTVPEMRLAGHYYSDTMSLKIGGIEFKYTSSDMPEHNPSVDIYSVKPVVEFNSVSPASVSLEWGVKSGWRYTTKSKSASNSVSNRFTLYAYPNLDFKNVALVGYYEIDVAAATIKVTDLGDNYEGAWSAFAYSSNREIKFSFAGGETISDEVSIGYSSGQAFYTPNGATTNILYVTFGSDTYTFELDNTMKIISVKNDQTSVTAEPQYGE